MALSASAMVTLIDETIEARLSGAKRLADADTSLDHYSLDELRKLRNHYQGLATASASSATGGLQVTKITNVSPSA